MTETAPREGLAPIRDRILSFAVPARDVRGRVIRLDASITAILAAHDYAPALARLLGEALVVTAMLGATLRENGGGLTLHAWRRESGLGRAIVVDTHAANHRVDVIAIRDRCFQALQHHHTTAGAEDGALRVFIESAAAPVG